MSEMSLSAAAGMLGVSVNASLGEIQKAYRLRALDCHPDKKPMDPIAVEKFRNLTDAKVVLEEAAQMFGDYSVRYKSPAQTLYDGLTNFIRRFDMKPLSAVAQEKLNLLDDECQSLKSLNMINGFNADDLDVIKQRIARIMGEFQSVERGY